MIFSPSQDQKDLQLGTREFLSAICTPELLRTLRDAENKTPSLWSHIAELGLPGFLISEPNGGLGMNAVGFALIAEEVGARALPEPLSAVAGVAAPVLNALGMSDLCSQIANGEKRVLPLHELNPYLNQCIENDALLQFKNDEIRLLEAGQYQLEKVESIDPLRDVSKIAVHADGQLLATGDQAKALTLLAEQHGAMCTAAELIGLARGMLDMSSAFTKDRQQFGKPIGSFQAVKHHLASALVAIEFARPVVYRAAADIASCAESTELSVAHAKLAATEAALQVAEAAIQVHGGMGYTFEVDLHLWMKRAWALAGEWGDRNHHMKKIETALFVGGLKTGPSATFVTE